MKIQTKGITMTRYMLGVLGLLKKHSNWIDFVIPDGFMRMRYELNKTERECYEELCQVLGVKPI